MEKRLSLISFSKFKFKINVNLEFKLNIITLKKKYLSTNVFQEPHHLFIIFSVIKFAVSSFNLEVTLIPN